MKFPKYLDQNKLNSFIELILPGIESSSSPRANKVEKLYLCLFVSSSKLFEENW